MVGHIGGNVASKTALLGNPKRADKETLGKMFYNCIQQRYDELNSGAGVMKSQDRIMPIVR